MINPARCVNLQRSGLPLLLGAHVSIAGTMDSAVDRALELGCTTFQIFTRNPRGWRYKRLKKKEVEAFSQRTLSCGFRVFAAHMPYLPNLASHDRKIRDRSLRALKTELLRCGALGIPYLVTHLGSHMGKGLEEGQRRVALACNRALEDVQNDVVLLLENTAGTKNSLGSSFEHIRSIMELIYLPERIGVCFDTSHGFAAGYDLRDSEAVERTMEEFDRAIGLDRLRMVHLNDSKVDLNKHADRHEHIGLGFIGKKGISAIISHKSLAKLPFVLETPVDERGDTASDLARVREIARSISAGSV